MKTNYIRLITFIALVSIIALQGIWLYNTYKLLETEFKKNISDLFIFSVEKETMLQLDDPIRKKERKNKVVEGAHPKNDRYINNRFFQDYFYKEGDPVPFSLEREDSIFNEESKKSFEKLDYAFQITDSAGNQTAFFNRTSQPVNERFAYKETIQLRNIAPEYITLVIASPYKIIFGKMLLLLIGSVLVVLFVMYSLIWQILIINKQNTIAKFRQDFTHSMIHDMKNPITSIVSGIDSLKSGKLDDKPKVKEHYYSIITQQGERIHRLVNKVLEIAHLEDGRIAVSKIPISLAEFLNGLIEKYKANTAKPVYFHLELNGVETIDADPHYIYEAFDNIFENAIKYSKENEDADLTISCIQKSNETQLTFKDLGIGIPEKDRKKIFQKFERSMAVIKSKNKISGFGLGLNFVYQVIKAHGGTIEVKSKLGSYSEFIINLPFKYENDKTLTD